VVRALAGKVVAMKRVSRWAALLVLVLLGLAVVALTRPTPPYGGRVLYLHLHLAPYMVPGTSKEIQYLDRCSRRTHPLRGDGAPVR
jgi:hypothetical protein